MVSAHEVELKEGWFDMAKPSDKAKKEMYEETRENKSHLSKAENAKEMTKKAREKEAAKKKQDTADKVYKESYRQYTKEENNPNADFPKADRSLYRIGDRLGDVVRGVGKKFGSNQMTSRDDEAQMKARRDVKGFKKGGKVKGRRGDGICSRGRTKGRMV